MKIILILFIFSLSICGQSKLASEEYDVYETILNNVYYKNRQTYSGLSDFVILRETRLDPKLELDALLSKRYKNLIGIFKRKNLSPAIVERKFPFDTYHMVDQKELDGLFARGEIEDNRRLEAESKDRRIINSGGMTWMPFYEKFPDSHGYYILSRIAFNANKTLALAHVKEESIHSGFSKVYVVRKNRGSWKIINRGGSVWVD